MVFDELVEDLDEPPGRDVATLRYDEPLEESGGGPEGGEWYGILVGRYLVERRHKVEQGQYMSFSQGVKHLVDTRDGQLPPGAHGVGPLVVYH